MALLTRADGLEKEVEGLEADVDVRDEELDAQRKLTKAAEQRERTWRRTSDTVVPKLKAENKRLAAEAGALRATVEPLESRAKALEEALEPAEAKLAQIPGQVRVRVPNGDGVKGTHLEYPLRFSGLAMELLATGASSPAIRKQLRAFQAYYLPWLGHEGFEIPQADWFNKMRHRLGICAAQLAAAEVAAADTVYQQGWDETSIDQLPGLDLWVRIASARDPTMTRTVFLSAFRVQSSAESEKVADGVSAIWEESRALLAAAKTHAAAAGYDDADLFPERGGGLVIGKVEASITDNCNPAKACKRIVTVRIIGTSPPPPPSPYRHCHRHRRRRRRRRVATVVIVS